MGRPSSPELAALGEDNSRTYSHVFAIRTHIMRMFIVLPQGKWYRDGHQHMNKVSEDGRISESEQRVSGELCKMAESEFEFWREV